MSFRSLYILLVLMCNHLTAAQKINLSLEHQTIWSKTNFESSLRESDFQGTFIRHWLRDADLKEGVWDSGFGIRLSYSTNTNWTYGLILRTKNRGQQSNYYFNVANQTNIDQYPKGYGGQRFKLLYQSTELGLGMSKVYGLQKLDFSSGISASLDVRNGTIIYDLILIRQDGIMESGCCTNTRALQNTDKSYTQLFSDNLKYGYVRLSFGMRQNFSYQIASPLSITSGFELQYISNVLGDDRFVRSGAVLSGNIWDLSFHLGIKTQLWSRKQK